MWVDSPGKSPLPDKPSGTQTFVYVPHLVVSNFPQCWFKMGGTTEHADNFVPIDERFVSFFVSQKQECRGRSPLPGCGVSPQTSFFLSPPQAARKGLFS